jgi:hypothetical protein
MYTYTAAFTVYVRRVTAETTIYHFGALEVIALTDGEPRFYTRRTGHFAAAYRDHIRETFARA